MIGIKYECHSSPDENNSSRCDIDFILISTAGHAKKIAVEHTIIESFERQIEYSYRSYDIVAEIDRICQGRIPTDRYYYLTVPHVLIRSLEKRKKKTFIQEMAAWVIQQANKIQVYEHASRMYSNHKIRLFCGGTHPAINGKVGRIPEIPQDIDQRRIDRFNRAVIETSRKIVKLMRYKLKGFSTVFLVEDVTGIIAKLQHIRHGLTFLNRVLLRFLVDYIIVLASVCVFLIKAATNSCKSCHLILLKTATNS